MPDCILWSCYFIVCRIQYSTEARKLQYFAADFSSRAANGAPVPAKEKRPFAIRRKA